MARRNVAHDRASALRLGVIDELGRVIEAVYITEITGNTGSFPKQPATEDSHRRPRDH